MKVISIIWLWVTALMAVSTVADSSPASFSTNIVAINGEIGDMKTEGH